MTTKLKFDNEADKYIELDDSTKLATSISLGAMNIFSL